MIGRPSIALKVTAAVLGVVILALSWTLGRGAAGPAYLLLFGLWLVPGLPIGWLVFGVRHPAAWIAGAVLGYPISALSLWLPFAAGWASALAFLTSWTVVTAAIWLLSWRHRDGRVPVPPWRSRDVTALLLVLLLVPALVGRPFARIGSQAEDGSRRYRAYFTADFVWHMGLTAELEKREYPPRNPYLASEPLHYYWLYFMPPAVAGAMLPVAPQIEGRLAINALGTGVLLLSAIFLLTWIGIGRAGPAALGVALALLAPSAEGLYAAIARLRRGYSLEVLRDLNIDAITSWDFHAFTIDGLLRALMYNPQHSFSCASGLLALVVVAAAGAEVSLASALVCGVALGFSLMLSPFPGGVITLVFGLAVAWDLVAARQAFLRRAATMAAGIVPIGAALLWVVWNRVLEGAGGDLRLGLHSRATIAPFTALALALGPLLVAVTIGAAVNWRAPRRLRPALLGVTIALALIFFVSLESADVWVGWRAGQVLLVTAPALAAHGLMRLSTGRLKVAGCVLASLLFAVGLPTTVVDVFNAQDVENDHMGPGFRWVVSISRQERQALEWVRAHTSQNAIVQMEPTSRGRETWTLIPSFAARRMSAGLPISLLDAPIYHDRSAQVRALYTETDPDAAWRTARTLQINYLYLGTVERQQFPQAETTLGSRPDLFAPVFRNQEVRIFRVGP